MLTKRFNRHQLEIIALIVLIVFTFSIAFLPRYYYKYPLHIDEWNCIISANSLLHGKNAMATAPGSDFGFITFLCGLKTATGLSWPVIFRYTPSVISVIFVLLVYALTKKWGHGLESAFLASLLQATPRFLGFHFLVPMTVALICVLISFILLFHYRKNFIYPLLFVIWLLAFFVHGTTPLILYLLVFVYVILTFKKEFWHSMKLLIVLCSVVSIASILIFPYLNMNWVFLDKSSFFLTPLNVKFFFNLYGYLPFLFFVLGAFILLFRREDEYKLVVGTFLLILVIMSLGTFFQRLRGIQALQDRSISCLTIIMSIIGGRGLKKISNYGHIVYTVVIIVTLLLAVNIQVTTAANYYHMIDEQEYEDFMWIKENLNETYDKAILDTWKAVPFVAITDKKAYLLLSEGASEAFTEKNRKTVEFFQDNCKNTSFLTENRISIVYTTGRCDNPDLIQVRERIYILKC
ncbi:MAG: hypothetical protein QMC80_04660 [Thermoplasmatales archaeon]|nr:hypothetical protein [Thermoplasmatales archaeon]